MSALLCPRQLTIKMGTTVRSKQRIAANFSRAASSYDMAATLQKRVATKTIEALPCQLGSWRRTQSRILDLGTGTGIHTEALANKYVDAHVIGMDLAMGMLQFARQQINHPRITWCSGDIESLPLQPNAVDLVYSSLAIQWCCFDQVLHEVDRVLKPGGLFVFSTLSAGSLQELDTAWQRIGENGRVNSFDRSANALQSLHRSGLMQQSASFATETEFYPDLITLLRAMKALGVNTVLAGKEGLLTRQRLLSLQQSYEVFRRPEGLPLTYRVFYGVLQKPLQAEPK